MRSRLRSSVAETPFNDGMYVHNASIFFLKTVLTLAFVGVGISFVLNVFTRQTVLLLALHGLAIAGLGLPFVLLRMNRTRTASAIFILEVWAIITVSALFLGEITGTVLPAYFAVTVIAALLFGLRGVLGMAVLNALALGGLHGLYRGDALPDVSSSGDSSLVTSANISLYIITGLLIYFVFRVINHDYSRLRRNEAELQKALADLQQTSVSKAYADNIIQSMRNLLVVINPDGTIRTANQATLQTLGYTEKELIGQPFNAVIVVEDDPQSLNTTQLIRLDQVEGVRQFYRSKSGEEIQVSFYSAVMYRNDGALEGIVCVAQDESRQVAAERTMRHQSTLLEAVSDAIISTTMDWEIITWNKAAEDIYGWKADEVQGQDLTELLFARQEDRRPITAGHKENNFWRGEMVQRRKDGSTLHVALSATLMHDQNNQPTGIVTVNHDITDRKEAQLKLTRQLSQLAILRQLNDAVSSTLDVDAVMDIALTMAADLSDADHGFIVLLGDDGSQMAQKLGGYVTLYPDDTFEVPHIARRVMQNQEPTFIEDIQHDAAYVPDSLASKALIGLPLIAQDGIMMGLINLETTREGHFTVELFDFLQLLANRIAVAVDNAQLYRVSQQQVAELKDLYGQVSKLEQLKTDMIRIASHDLRAPLGIMIGYVDLIKMDVWDRLTETEKDYLDVIDRSIGRIQGIIADILSLERIHQLAKEPLQETVNLRQIVQVMHQTHQPEAKYKKQTLSLHIADSPSAFNVKGDSSQLGEAVSNLITNAIKYTQDGGLINVSLDNVGDRVQVKVVDNGYGVPENQQQYLFEPFSRADNETTYNIAGYGLGLNLVKNIIDRHQGEIIFESVYGEGSTFGFRLPRVDDETAAPSSISEST